MAVAAAAMVKRTAKIASRSLQTSSSRVYAPVAPRTDLVPAASNSSFSTTALRSILEKNNFGTHMDGWAACNRNSIVKVASFGRAPRPCQLQLSCMVPTLLRFMTSVGSSSGAVSHSAPALPSDAPPRIKFKRLDKTARHIMQILDKEAVEQVKGEREIPDIRPGYIVQLKVEVPENKRRVSIVKGRVIARRNAGLNTTFRLRRAVAGVYVESLYPLYSPNIKEIKVLDKKKKVRRAKLYYLRDRNERS